MTPLKRRPGNILALGSFALLCGGTFYLGPRSESIMHKKVLAGTMAGVSVELGTHVIDTVNVCAKV